MSVIYSRFSAYCIAAGDRASLKKLDYEVTTLIRCINCINSLLKRTARPAYHALY